jgi:hypothetical protein
LETEKPKKKKNPNPNSPHFEMKIKKSPFGENSPTNKKKNIHTHTLATTGAKDS